MHGPRLVGWNALPEAMGGRAVVPCAAELSLGVRARASGGERDPAAEPLAPRRIPWARDVCSSMFGQVQPRGAARGRRHLAALRPPRPRRRRPLRGLGRRSACGARRWLAARGGGRWPTGPTGPTAAGACPSLTTKQGRVRSFADRDSECMQMANLAAID